MVRSSDNFYLHMDSPYLVMTERFEHRHLFSAWPRNKNLVHELIGNHGLVRFCPDSKSVGSERFPERHVNMCVVGWARPRKSDVIITHGCVGLGTLTCARRVLGPRRGQTDGRDSKRIFYAVRASPERE